MLYHHFTKFANAKNITAVLAILHINSNDYMFKSNYDQFAVEIIVSKSIFERKNCTHSNKRHFPGQRRMSH